MGIDINLDICEHFGRELEKKFPGSCFRERFITDENCGEDKIGPIYNTFVLELLLE